uniref:Uncharacterized protein n=1 Tax=Anguilla anguilla TaxID=7936 RepID=A0A0E9SCR6_ANGAN
MHLELNTSLPITDIKTQMKSKLWLLTDSSETITILSLKLLGRTTYHSAPSSTHYTFQKNVHKHNEDRRE